MTRALLKEITLVSYVSAWMVKLSVYTTEILRARERGFGQKAELDLSQKLHEFRSTYLRSFRNRVRAKLFHLKYTNLRPSSGKNQQGRALDKYNFEKRKESDW